MVSKKQNEEQQKLTMDVQTGVKVKLKVKVEMSLKMQKMMKLFLLEKFLHTQGII